MERHSVAGSGAVEPSPALVAGSSARDGGQEARSSLCRRGVKVGTRDDLGAGADATVRECAGGQKVFGRYTLKTVLGRGGMGIVWLARDEELEREVALKFLPDVVVHDRSLLEELKRETRRSLELTHRNIVRIHDFVFNESSACISMEYVDGNTLATLRVEKEQKVFEPNELSGWTSQLCEALDYAHNYAKIIHRDLKPANLMVNKKGDLKVSDFGIARSLGDSVSRLTIEQGRSGEPVVPAADADAKNTRNSATQKNRYHRWRCGSLSDRDRWMVFHEIKSTRPISAVRFEHTGNTTRARLGKEHRRFAV